jgi:hypothetical protein
VRRSSVRVAVGVVAVALVAALAACDNMLTGELTPVPPVHRAPDGAVGTVILLDEDPAIETKDPVHVQRAMENRVPQDFRASMVRSLELAGFRVSSRKDAPHALVAKLALAVSEEKGTVRQVYRCKLLAPGGAIVEQVDWAWPKGTYVDPAAVFTFATNHVASELATSRRLAVYLRGPVPVAPVAPVAPPAPDAGL